MAVSGSSDYGMKDDCLPFEGMLEALCRLSAIKALPTDEEIAEKGCSDAGQYVLLMDTDDDLRQEYDEMLRERAVGWGGKPAQPLETCVDMTLSIILRKLKHQVHKGTKQYEKKMQTDLTAEEMEKYITLIM